MKTVTYALTLFLATWMMQGCGLSPFISPEEDAVVDEHVFWNIPWIENTGVRALSTKMERRLILIDRKGYEDEKGKQQYYLTICAEPQAEATQSLTGGLNISIKAPGEASDEKSIKVDRPLKTEVEAPFRRSQGLQFYRDGAFQLCQAYLNDILPHEDPDPYFHPCPQCYLTQLELLRDAAKEIMLKEMEQGFYRVPKAAK